MKSNLARYKVPREIMFIDEMPRNPAGKVMKRKLPDLDGEGDDGDGDDEGGTGRTSSSD